MKVKTQLKMIPYIVQSIWGHQLQSLHAGWYWEVFNTNKGQIPRLVLPHPLEFPDL